MWVYPPNCRTKVGARWSPSFPRQSLARRRARNIVQVHAHALNGSWECYRVVRIGLGTIWGDHGRRRSLHFTTPHFCLKKGWVYPLCPFPLFFFPSYFLLSYGPIAAAAFVAGKKFGFKRYLHIIFRDAPPPPPAQISTFIQTKKTAIPPYMSARAWHT